MPVAELHDLDDGARDRAAATAPYLAAARVLQQRRRRGARAQRRGERRGEGGEELGDRPVPEVDDEADEWGPPASERSCGTRLSEREKRGGDQGQRGHFA